jgi:hypothetical protein
MARDHQATSANDAFAPALWTTFVSTTLGLEHLYCPLGCDQGA